MDGYQNHQNNNQGDFRESIAVLHGKVDAIIESLGVFSNAVDSRFDAVDSRFDAVDSRFDGVETTMVTKTYLDEKLGDFKGDLVTLIRKEDKKLSALVELLRVKNLLTQEEAQKIFSLEPFPQS